MYIHTYIYIYIAYMYSIWGGTDLNIDVVVEAQMTFPRMGERVLGILSQLLWPASDQRFRVFAGALPSQGLQNQNVSTQRLEV